MKIKAIREVIEKNLNNERAYSNSFGSGSTKIGSLFASNNIWLSLCNLIRASKNCL